MISRLFYYLSSTPTILRGVRNWPLVFAAILGLPIRKPFVVELREHGLRLKARTALDAWIIKEACLDRDYENVCTDLQDGWVVIDIGAGLGDFSIFVAKRFPKSHVYAFEPNPDSARLLLENVRLNSVSNVTLLPYAIVGSSSRSTQLLATSVEPAQHRALATTFATISPNVPTLEVQGWSLDEVFEKLALERCDFLKMDCEGAEYEILFGARRATLARIAKLCMEYHEGVTPYTHRDLEAYLQANGFRTRRRPNPAHKNLGFLYASRA